MGSGYQYSKPTNTGRYLNLDLDIDTFKREGLFTI